MIRLIASDLDDTLLPEGTSFLNPEYFDVIRALHETGILFVAASGRHYNSMKRLLAPVRDELIFLCGNGTCVVRQGSLMDLRELERGLFTELLSAFHALDPGIVLVDQPDKSWSDEPDREALDRLMSGYGLNVLYTENLASLEGPILKIALHTGGDAAQAAAPVRERFGRRANVMAAGSRWVDVVPEGTDKGSSLSAIQRQLGIRPEETMVFGDNENDIGMLRLAAESYAVGNARQAVKEAAAHVVGDVREDAVLKVLKSLL